MSLQNYMFYINLFIVTYLITLIIFVTTAANFLSNSSSVKKRIALQLFLVIQLLSFAGAPFLLGFFGKVPLMIFLLKTNTLGVYFLVIILNYFMFYFYIQSFKYLGDKKGVYNDTIYLRESLAKRTRLVLLGIGVHIYSLYLFPQILLFVYYTQI